MLVVSTSFSAGPAFTAATVALVFRIATLSLTDNPSAHPSPYHKADESATFMGSRAGV